jgi:energy-converting hydrogenase Eha subunit H
MKILDQVFKISIILTILLIGFSVFYYYVIFVPQKEEARLEQQKLNRAYREMCVSQAETRYNRCLEAIRDFVDRGGIITPENVDVLQEDCLKNFETAKDTCVKKHPIQ